MSFKTLIAGAAALAISGVGSAQAATWIASGTGINGPESAHAVITANSNVLTVQLTDLLATPPSAGQELSGIELFFADDPTSATLNSSSGTLITINAGRHGAANTWTTDTTDSITHWGVALSDGNLFLATAGTGAQGGTPVDLIIDGGGNYSNANSSIVGHDPQIQGGGTFNLTLGGLTSPVITGVTFEFGTQAENTLSGTCTSLCGVTTITQQETNAVPAPATWALMIGGFFGAGLMLRSRRRQAAAQA